MQTIDVYQVASAVEHRRTGPEIGQQQAQMAMAALRGASSGPALAGETADPADDSEDDLSLDWWMACPYCCAHTYRLTFTPVEGGLMMSGECSRCHTRGQTLLT